jgi:hypothetical protein
LAFWFENKPSGNPATNHNSQEREKHDPGLSLKKAVDGSTGWAFAQLTRLKLAVRIVAGRRRLLSDEYQ